MYFLGWGGSTRVKTEIRAHSFKDLLEVGRGDNEGAEFAYLARQESRSRLESRQAAPPTRNRQLGMSMERSLPKYQFCVMFSVDTTTASACGYLCDEQPMSSYTCLVAVLA